MRPTFAHAAALVAICTWLTPVAEAHRLKLFATVEGGVVTGYGFFIGGGRPSDARLLIRNKAGVELYNGPAGRDASFSFKPAAATELFLVMDAGDGHVADAHIRADRFPAAGPLAAVAQAAGRAPARDAAPAEAGLPGTAAAGSREELAALVDRSVDRAVSRQIAPLLEAYAEADGRARFTDVVSGIAMIIGLSGLLMWARSWRRRGRQQQPDTRDGDDAGRHA